MWEAHNDAHFHLVHNTAEYLCQTNLNNDL
jgi:hypothetical protein